MQQELINELEFIDFEVSSVVARFNINDIIISDKSLRRSLSQEERKGLGYS